jgi:imidazolonepropionase-like amidohydrolase
MSRSWKGSGLFCLCISLLWAAAVPNAVADTPKSNSAPCAFLHANVVPMTDERLLRDQTVVVENGAITQIGPSKTVLIPRGACRIEAKGRFLIPGLADAHVHLLSPNELPLYLANGVTTVLNLDGHSAHLLWRKQIARGEMVGPNIFTTGPIFERARTAAEDVRMVDEQAAAGYDGVKIYNQVSKAEYPALVAEAKKKNLLLMGHVAREPDFEMTLQSGQSIAHLEEFTYTFFNPLHDNNNRHIVYDESRIPEAVRLTKEAGIFVTPTLATYATIVQQASDLETFLKNPDMKYLPSWAQAQYQPAANRYKNGFSPEDVPRIRTSLAFQRKLVKALSDAGVPLMSGTDAPEVGPLPGFGIHDELQEFVDDGMTPYQALQTASVNVARYLRHAGDFGTIEVGKRADLVLLEGNPLVAIASTRRVVGVMLRGQWLPQAELSRMVDDVPASYQRELRRVKAELRSNPAAADAYLQENDPYLGAGETAIVEIASSEGFEQTHDLVKKIRQAVPKSGLVSEEGINHLGYSLLGKKLTKEAIAVFQMNTEDFPKSANTFDSLAEAQFNAGDLPHALENYRKALSVDPAYGNAKAAEKFLKEKGQH